MVISHLVIPKFWTPLWAWVLLEPTKVADLVAVGGSFQTAPEPVLMLGITIAPELPS